MCDCTCSNVMYMLKYLLIKPQKDFWVFYMFLKVILYFCAFSFCSKCIFVFFFKNWFRGLFARSLQLKASREGKLKSHIFIQKVSLLPRESFATKLFSQNVFRQKLKIFKFIQRLSRLSRNCFATKGFSRKLQYVLWLSHDCFATF